MLKINQLKKQYKNFTLNCSMEVKKRMITGFVGPNGSGKSTTLKAVLGLISIDEGEIQVFGKNVKDIKPEDKEKIGVVLSDSGFSRYLTMAGVDLVDIMLNHMYLKDTIIGISIYMISITVWLLSFKISEGIVLKKEF